MVDNPHDPPRQWTYRVQVSTSPFYSKGPSISKAHAYQDPRVRLLRNMGPPLCLPVCSVQAIPGSSGVVTWHAGLALSDVHRNVATSLDDTVWVLGSVGNKVTPGDGEEASKQVRHPRFGGRHVCRWQRGDMWTSASGLSLSTYCPLASPVGCVPRCWRGRRWGTCWPCVWRPWRGGARTTRGTPSPPSTPPTPPHETMQRTCVFFNRTVGV